MNLSRRPVPMLRLESAVIAVVMPEGARAAVRLRGKVVGRTHEADPRYDVLAEDGRVYRNLRGGDLERVAPAGATTPPPSAPKPALLVAA